MVMNPATNVPPNEAPPGYAPPQYGAPPAAGGYVPPGYPAPGAPYGQPQHAAPPGVPYGQPPPGVPYGQPQYAAPPGAPYGQPQYVAAPSVPYGQPQYAAAPGVPYGQPQYVVAPGNFAPAPMAPAQGYVLMQPPTVNIPANCPPGLEYLSLLNALIIKQKVEPWEVITGIETENEYKVLNAEGHLVYKAKEESDFCARQCLGANRPFRLNIKDNIGRDIIRIRRPYACSTVYCPFILPCNFFWLQTLEVVSPITNQILGCIEQSWDLCSPRFKIRDAAGNHVLNLHGPGCYMVCPCNCCNDVNFRVLDLSGNEVGRVAKKWSGLLKEMLTDADNFSITFPQDLDINIKAVLLGAVFLIDFMYFEDSPNQNRDY